MKYFLLCLITLLSVTLFSQTDTEFWFAAPDVSSVHGSGDKNGTPLYLHVTAQYATNVRITRPAEPSFPAIEFFLNALEHRSIRLDNTLLPNGETLTIDEIENYPSASLTPQNKGFLIETDPGEVTVYYELDQYWNRDIFALKGTNGLGRNFIASTQDYYISGNYSGTAWSGFVIVATENNTTVTIYPNDGFLHFDPAPATITLNLDRGETYAFRAPVRAANRHPNGVRVEATEDIAITVYDDSMWGDPVGCYDIFGDQIVPTDIVGQEYIVMRGELNPLVGGRVFITPTKVPTEVFVDDVHLATMTRMDTVFSYKVTNNTHYIYCDEPVYVNHITGFGCELGGAQLPSIDNCTGSNDVTFTRTNNGLDAFYLNIMVRNDTNSASPTKNQAIKNFILTTNSGRDTIPEAYFEYIRDSTFAVLRDNAIVDGYFSSNIPPGAEALVQNSISRFHLGVINGGGSTGCKYGYFSDYAASAASAGIGGSLAPQAKVYCNMDPIHFVASGGKTYEWIGVSDPSLTLLLSDSTIADPYFYPDTTGDFLFDVNITQECFSDTTIKMLARVKIGPVSDFDLSENAGCSPFSPEILNKTDTNLAFSMNWIIKSTHDTVIVNNNTLTNPFNYTFPNNTSDTAQTYIIELLSKSSFGSCPNSREKGVIVYPYANSNFTIADTIGCHPLTIDITNTSVGNLDTNSYNWDFGDQTQATVFEPQKTYTNFSDKDTIYTLRLVTETPFSCLDTSMKQIVVHPRISVKFGADSTSSCSPLSATLNPSNSVGVDTLWWNIDYLNNDGIYDSTHKTLVIDPINIIHYDTSTAAGPDTLYVQLIGSNRMGCFDTAETRRLVTFPDVITDFTIDKSVVCDSVPITFTNNSFGYKLKYEWDFGNNTYSQDSTGQSYTKAFYNRTDADTVYTVNLTATSGYFCMDEMDTNITIHPYIKADFGLNYNNNCSPLNADITNTSVRAHTNKWDFGTGSIITDNNTLINRDFINPYLNSDTTFMIKLITSNSEGCSDSIIRPLSLFPQVIADFIFTGDSAGCSPLDVGIQNNSTGGSLTYTWNFGDYTTSTTSNVNFSKIYNNITSKDTIYTLKLTARNALGCDSILTRPVDVFAFVDADFNLPIVDSCSPFTIRPDNLSSAGAHFFEWDFDNGNTSTDFEPVVPSYIQQDEKVDSFDVQLVVYSAADPAHQACADTHIVPVIVYPELEADFAMSNTADCQPLLSTFTNNTNLIPGTDFLWYIEDRFYSADDTPLDLERTNYKDYDTTSTVYLYGRSQYGCRDTATQNITVYAYVDAYFSMAPSTICSADSIMFDQSYTSGEVTSRTWDFNGETTSNTTVNRFYHTFVNLFPSAAPVEKEITLTAFNGQGCSSVWIDTVTVNPQVIAEFDPDFAAVCYPHTTEFTNSSKNATQAQWVFGDGSSSFDTNPLHLYNNFNPAANKTYNVKLTATSDYSCFDTLTKQVTIYAKPSADFYFPIAVDCPPFDVNVVNNSLGSDLVYDWDYNGEGSSTLETPIAFTFGNNTNSTQSKYINLQVESDMGCKDTIEKSISVYPNVNVDFEYVITEGCSPLEVEFKGDTTNVSQLLWSIDGKAFSTVIDPEYRFVNETPGNNIHDITFKAYSIYDCSADTTKQVTVFPSPTAEFIPRPIPAEYGIDNDETPITFYNQTVFQDSWSYAWDYGDDNNDNESSGTFAHAYESHFWGVPENDYKIPVTLTAWNAANPECRDSSTHEIIIYPPLPQVDLGEDISGCQPFTVDFTSITKYIDEDKYEWEFGTIGDTSSLVEPTHTFTKPGTYTVKLQVYGDGGTNWAYKIVNVNPKPGVSFTFNDSVVYDSSQTKGYDWINFYNQTSYANSNTTWSWYFDVENNFGGSPDSEERDPSWHYSETGEYYIGLIAESGLECLDTFIHPVPIRVLSQGFVKFPTAFLVSPQGADDEYNTSGRNKYVFYPISSGVDEYRLEIYNRWGARVFETRDVNHGWNGFIEGQAAKQDVYIWRARGRYTNGDAFDTSGDVTLIHGSDEVVNP